MARLLTWAGWFRRRKKIGGAENRILTEAGDALTTEAGEHLVMDVAAPAPSSLLTGLVAYWKMDEASGTRVDSGPNGLHLTPSNAPVSVTGTIGDAALFEQASSQYLSHPDDVLLRVNGDWTWSFWVKMTTAEGNNGFLAKIDENTSVIEYAIGYWSGGDSRILGFLDDGSTSGNFYSPTPSPAIADTWYHILFQYDISENKAAFSVDGAALVWQTWGSGVQTSGEGPLYIGRDLWNFDYADAAIDEVGFWSRLLTTEERAALYNGGAGVTYPFS